MGGQIVSCGSVEAQENRVTFRYFVPGEKFSAKILSAMVAPVMVEMSMGHPQVKVRNVTAHRAVPQICDPTAKDEASRARYRQG